MPTETARHLLASLVEAPLEVSEPAEFLVRPRRVAAAASVLAAAPFAAVVGFPAGEGLLLALATDRQAFLLDAARTDPEPLRAWLAAEGSVKVVRQAPVLAERLQAVGLELAGAFDLAMGQAVLRAAREEASLSAETVGHGNLLVAPLEGTVRLAVALGLAKRYVNAFIGQRIALSLLESMLGRPLLAEVLRETARSVGSRQ